MASTLEDVQAAVSAIQQTESLLAADVQALVDRGSSVDLGPVIQALGAVNTSLVALDEIVKAALTPPQPQ